MSSVPSAALSGPNCEGDETSTPESNWSICLHIMPLLHLLCQRSGSGPSLLASNFCSGLFSMANSFLTMFSAAGYWENSHARHSSRVRMYPGWMPRFLGWVSYVQVRSENAHVPHFGLTPSHFSRPMYKY